MLQAHQGHQCQGRGVSNRINTDVTCFVTTADNRVSVKKDQDQMTEGFLFDSYPVGSSMVSWIKENNSMTRIEDIWTPSIYVSCDDKQELDKLSNNKKILPYVIKAEQVKRFEKVTDLEKTQVLQLQLKDSNSILQ